MPPVENSADGVDIQRTSPQDITDEENTIVQQMLEELQGTRANSTSFALPSPRSSTSLPCALPGLDVRSAGVTLATQSPLEPSDSQCIALREEFPPSEDGFAQSLYVPGDPEAKYTFNEEAYSLRTADPITSPLFFAPNESDTLREAVVMDVRDVVHPPQRSSYQLQPVIKSQPHAASHLNKAEPSPRSQPSGTPQWDLADRLPPESLQMQAIRPTGMPFRQGSLQLFSTTRCFSTPAKSQSGPAEGPEQLPTKKASSLPLRGASAGDHQVHTTTPGLAQQGGQGCFALPSEDFCPAPYNAIGALPRGSLQDAPPHAFLSADSSLSRKLGASVLHRPAESFKGGTDRAANFIPDAHGAIPQGRYGSAAAVSHAQDVRNLDVVYEEKPPLGSIQWMSHIDNPGAAQALPLSTEQSQDDGRARTSINAYQRLSASSSSQIRNRNRGQGVQPSPVVKKRMRRDVEDNDIGDDRVIARMCLEGYGVVLSQEDGPCAGDIVNPQEEEGKLDERDDRHIANICLTAFQAALHHGSETPKKPN